jgi:peptidoglycan hydrolase-like protein with peptidoglycan-binding domain
MLIGMSMRAQNYYLFLYNYMKKTLALGLLVSLVSITGASAMTMTATDTMMKKDDNMMKGDTMMKKDEGMMKGDTMMKNKIMSATKDAGMGARGENVTALQNTLISKGFLTGPATGYFGSATKKAVMAYQKSLGVTGTGYYGAKTRKMMEAGSMKKDEAMRKGDTMMKDKMTQ